MTTTTRNKKAARVSNSKDDILSRLPEHVLDRILCLLTQKEAVRTCVLSKSWRHLGPSRSKLELCRVTDFNNDIKKFKSAMNNTITRYNHQNPILKQLSLKLAPSHYVPESLNLPWVVASKALLLEQLYLEGCNLKNINLNAHKTRFNYLRKLSLVRCDITEEILEMLLSSTTCPLIECLCIIYCSRFKNLIVRNAPRLKHFEISHYELKSIVVDDVPTLETISIENCRDWRFLDNNNNNNNNNYFPRLKYLRLKSVKLSSEANGFLTSDYMPSLEKLELIDHCDVEEFWIKSSSSINNYFPRLKSLCLTRVRLSSETFGFFMSYYMPSLEKLELDRCYGCEEFELSSSSINNYFSRLKSLCLTCVRLSSETFGYFTPDYMPSLEKLELDGCQEFQLSSSSIKYLSIICDRGAIKAAIIDAPNLSCFKLKAYHPLPSLSFTPMISSEWKSHVHLTTNICNDRYDHTAPCLGIHEIHQLLKSLSQSQITLEIFLGKKSQRRILEAAHGGLYRDEPHVVEHLSLELGDYSFSTVQSMFRYLFHVCRPRYIYDVPIKLTSKDITSRILWKLLLDEREKMGYFWNQDLVEVSMESSSNYMNPKEWKSVPGNSLSECHNQNIRFRLKWRGM